MLVGHEGGEEPFDAHWRLLHGTECLTPIMMGRSASGAAALGWYHLLRGTVPDAELIVVAQVDDDNPSRLKAVGGVDVKTAAIVDDGRFDTIVVADQTDKDEAEAVLRARGKLGSIRVVNLDARNL